MNQLNASLRNVFQEIVERRLWPVALVLAVALVAIPVLLSNPASSTPSASPVSPAAPATGTGGPLSAFQPVVNTEGSKSSEIRKRLQGFQPKDPFKVQGLGGGGGSEASGATGESTTLGAGTGTTLEPGAGGDTSGSGTSGSGTSGSGTSGSGQSGSGTSGQSGSITYFTWTATVRFGIGDNADQLDKKRLERFRALPSSENPVVVFMGVTTDGEKAVFLVSTASGTTGEGDCEPDDTCTFLYMKPGQTQSFEAVDEDDQVVTYKLKLIDTNVEKTDPPKSSSSSASRRASTRAQRRARRAERMERDRRDEGFAARVEAVGF
jgi:hypothetical protein